jgi:hypothetical protein
MWLQPCVGWRSGAEGHARVTSGGLASATILTGGLTVTHKYGIHDSQFLALSASLDAC